ncbi:DNA phosphorothioation system sulfurtransferase DndC [Actinocrinis puniceicyclus]|uniref:DNA phosphorothioation system sulfurtransferase DndC n=1 Tax=Actinocrinis puniceicyclus TaxID=977794 RepID=A0A8J7WNF6_9ACTN|nr:DNA phosphorothioation system sulfurtransferase DndC [Actinocrinis puniceicyclus]MBS2965626.1 DNA phosphorothioation system sulfurtransferase DndC [Actinocrinis puniceicyclus]
MNTLLPVIPTPTRRAKPFGEVGLGDTVRTVVAEIAQLYQADAIPWVVGYSGGKDSTATLQLVWQALVSLPPEERTKPVHVISTDTMVENPVVAAWVNRSLEVMRAKAEKLRLPLTPHKLTPEITDTFWVNLIGKGYPAPRPKFRWCTERLKINPSNSFIRRMVRQHGEAILVLGTRKAESAARSKVMTALEAKRVRERLSPNAKLPNSLVYSPIEAWSSDEVWMYLMQFSNPWGYSNKDLLTMYQGASADSECPLVVDTSTPSCGDSRFGCWTCTLVEQDKSMTAMITNDAEKEWMLPLLDLRNALDVADDRPLRDFRRMNGSVQLFHDRPIPGPYTQKARTDWLRQLLAAQEHVRFAGPPEVSSIELISLAELEEIRRIWVIDKHEFEDVLPKVYKEITGREYPGRPLDEALPLGAVEIELLAEICGEDRLHFETVRNLLDIERRHRNQLRRAKLFPDLEKAITRGFYADEDDAIAYAHRRRDLTAANSSGVSPQEIASGYVQPVADRDDALTLFDTHDLEPGTR